MIVQNLTPKAYQLLCQTLQSSAYHEPWDASYSVTMMVNGDEFTLRLQPEKHCRMAVLQAIRIVRSKPEPVYTLIQKSSMLTALFELFVLQSTSLPSGTE